MDGKEARRLMEFTLGAESEPDESRDKRRAAAQARLRELESKIRSLENEASDALRQPESPVSVVVIPTSRWVALKLAWHFLVGAIFGESVRILGSAEALND